jgi:hypothetical protein
MVNIKPIAVISAKYVKNAQAAAPDYEAGIRTPQNDYARNTIAAEGSYNSGVQAAIGRKAFSKGVSASGTQKWQDKSISKGVPRYPAGVADAEPDFTKGFSPYADTLSRLTLPPSRAKGDPANLQRVAVIAKALRDKKIGMSGSAGGG